MAPVRRNAILRDLQRQWDRYFERIGHDFQFLTRPLELFPECHLILSRLGNYRARRRLTEGECGLCGYLEKEAELSHPALSLDGTYHFHVNIYPTVQYVVIFTHQRHISMEANVVNYPHDLRRMLQIAETAGISIFHNMRDAASSIPEHEHFQGLLFRAPIQRWPMRRLGTVGQCDLWTLSALPGANYVFRGGDPIPEVLDYLRSLGDVPYTLGILPDPLQVIVFPRRHEKSLYPERRWGGTEMLGVVACRQEMYDQADAELKKMLVRNYEHVLYPPGTLLPAGVRPCPPFMKREA